MVGLLSTSNLDSCLCTLVNIFCVETDNSLLFFFGWESYRFRLGKTISGDKNEKAGKLEPGNYRI